MDSLTLEIVARELNCLAARLQFARINRQTRDSLARHLDSHTEIVTQVDYACPAGTGCTETITAVYDEAHSVDDKPAIICAAGICRWMRGGLVHRGDDQPAAIFDGGMQYWAINGSFHRDGDLPAFIWLNEQGWFQHGLAHREGDKPAVVTPTLTAWYQYGKLHRGGDEPARIHTSGALEWLQNGLLHREGGQPAFIGANGHRRWFLHGKEYIFAPPT